MLGSTYEVVTLPDDIAARVEGKSSLGRLGLLTHATAGFVDPGFSGHVTLELANVATLPIKLYPGMKIGQFCFFRLSSPSEHPYGSEKYGSRYQGQRGPTPVALVPELPPDLDLMASLDGLTVAVLGGTGPQGRGSGTPLGRGRDPDRHRQPRSGPRRRDGGRAGGGEWW